MFVVDCCDSSMNGIISFLKQLNHPACKSQHFGCPPKAFRVVGDQTASLQFVFITGSK